MFARSYGQSYSNLNPMCGWTICWIVMCEQKKIYSDSHRSLLNYSGFIIPNHLASTTTHIARRLFQDEITLSRSSLGEISHHKVQQPSCLYLFQRKLSTHLMVGHVITVFIIIISCGLSMSGAELTNERTSLDGSVLQERIRAFCLDSNGTMRGLFSTWVEPPNCSCTCKPTAGRAMSVCELCDPGEHVKGPLVPTMRNGGEAKQNPVTQGKNAESDKPLGRRKGCLYEPTGTKYRHTEIWMSANLSCVKCHCNDGTIRCDGEPHHCPPLCFPGQKAMTAGPCCETICQGKALQTNNNISNCLAPKTSVVHEHGEFVTFGGSCVDEKCLCVNGRWSCLDYCTPIAKLPCKLEDVIMWNPFCCPRCPGSLNCNIEIYNHSSENLRHFQQRNAESIRTISHEQKSARSIPNLSSPPTSVTVKTGTEIVLKQGHCICLNSTILCSRPGRNIWHDDDCYYLENQEGVYYPSKAQWIPNGDTCTQCICLENRTYTCKPKECTNFFVCPKNETPLVRNGECCPSYCGKRITHDSNEEENDQLVDHPNIPEISNGQLGDSNRVTPIPKSNVEENMPFDVPSSYGCPSIGTRVLSQTQRFPTGSRLILDRPCRSLLCICARDDRWLCTDHCPPCMRTFEAIENLNKVPKPPSGYCCPPCNTDGTGAAWLPSNRIQTNAHLPIYGPPVKDPSTYPQYTPLDEHIVYNRFPYIPGNPLRHPYEELTHGRPVTKINNDEHIRSTLKLYVLVAGIILFLILTIPMVLFIAWYAISRRRRKYNHRDIWHTKRSSRRKHNVENSAPLLSSSAADRNRFRCSNLNSSSPASSSPPHIKSKQINNNNNNNNFTTIDDESCRQTEEENEIIDEVENIRCSHRPSELKWIRAPRDVSKDTSNADEDIILRTNAAKSVPSSPVTQCPEAKPRRVQSNAHYSATIDRSIHSRESNPNIEQFINTPKQVNMSPSMRRTASNVSARHTSFNKPIKTTLTRASTWLTGTKNPAHIVNYFSRLRQPRERSNPKPILTWKQAEMRIYQAENDPFMCMHDDSNQPADDVTPITPATPISERPHRVKLWSHSQGQLPFSLPEKRIVQPTRSLREPDHKIEDHQIVLHHFVNAARSGKTQISNHAQQQPQQRGSLVQNDLNYEAKSSKSPDTDNTSMTDSKSTLDDMQNNPKKGNPVELDFTDQHQIVIYCPQKDPNSQVQSLITLTNDEVLIPCQSPSAD